MQNWQNQVTAILADPASSYSLQRALKEFLGKDQVDALNDIDMLHFVFKARHEVILAEHRAEGLISWFDEWTIYPAGVIVRAT